jgi:predicted anti-sigma-YlaC factor YlaD
VTTEDHTIYREEVGAYLLGALTDPEREAFEAHLADCAECRNEVERLRPAADLLPRSVEQVEPPPSLKRSLMEVVNEEAAEHAPRHAIGPSLGERLRGWFGPMRPMLAAGVLALGLLVGFGVAQLSGGDDSRTVQASVTPAGASASLTVQDDGGILEVRGMPSLRPGRVYQAWVQRGGMISPAPTFDVAPDGAGAGAVPGDLSGAEAVLVTSEPRGGSQQPTEDPVLKVSL